MFYSFKIVASLGICAVVKASNPFDVTTASLRTRPNRGGLLGEVSFDSTCLPRDLTAVFSGQSELCLQNDQSSILTSTTSPMAMLQNSSLPWTIEPSCITNSDDSLCVFTNGNLGRNRGISVMTKPSIAAGLSQLSAFTSDTDTIHTQKRPPPFEVVDIPGRGKGVIANRTIEPGDLIFGNAAIAIFHNDAFEDETSPELMNMVKKTVHQLPNNTQSLFMGMATHTPDNDPYLERIYVNTFAETFGDEEHSIVIPETARLNHDCRPNAVYHFDSQSLTHYTHAARRIYAGEEITITYVDPLQTRFQRRAAIQRSWGFECTCSLCTTSADLVQESNHRIKHIKQLTDLLEESVNLSEAKDGRKRSSIHEKATPEMAELLISLYEQERLYASIAEGYRLAALSYSAAGKEWMAIKWALKALETHIIHDGKRDPTVTDMRNFLLSPREHWSWAMNI